MVGHSAYETYVSVREPIEVVASILGARLVDDIDDLGPVRYADVADFPVRFTLFGYRDKPGWSHILSTAPDDDESLVSLLSRMGVADDGIDVSVDENSDPCRDLAAIRNAVADLRRRSRN